MKNLSIGLQDEGLKMRGFVEVILTREDTGEVVDHYTSENLVVNGGRAAMAHMWAGEWFTGPYLGYVNEMKFGDRGHETADPTLPKETDVERTQLFCEDESRPVIISKPVAIDYPDGDQGTTVRFTCTIAASEGNGTGRAGYSEAGLYRADGTLGAHKTFGIITKTNEFVLTIRWTFKF
jgi:hypothetical protein